MKNIVVLTSLRVPKDLWKRVKIAAVNKDMGSSQLIVELLDKTFPANEDAPSINRAYRPRDKQKVKA